MFSLVKMKSLDARFQKIKLADFCHFEVSITWGKTMMKRVITAFYIGFRRMKSDFVE